MAEIQTAAEENFERRIAAHLREKYAKTIVSLPDKKLPVDELPEGTLLSLVRTGIERARTYGLSFESSIAAFSAIMFEVAPNFDTHKLSQVILNDENTEPNARLDELLEILTEGNWETIRKTYDAAAWQLKAEE